MWLKLPGALASTAGISRLGLLGCLTAAWPDVTDQRSLHVLLYSGWSVTPAVSDVLVSGDG